jgi:glutamate-1-semialdehyde 2,1-aminomutase
MTAGIETLRALKQPGFYERLEASSAHLAAGLQDAAQRAGYPIYSTRVGSMFCSFFTPNRVIDWDSASTSDTKAFAHFFGLMLERGIYLAPSQFETAFMSIAHTPEDIEATITAAYDCFKQLA